MPNEVVWESKEAATGVQVRAELGDSGIVLTLRRRAVMLERDSPLAAGWFVHSQLGIWWPSPIDEAMRLIAHWLDFYDTSLRAGLRPLAEKLVAIPDPANRGSMAPPGSLPS